MTSVTWTAHRTSALTRKTHVRLRVAAIMTAAVSVLTFAHYVEIAVWATAYWLLGVVEQAGEHFYFAFVNYTTLGYGDIVPVEYWRLLGPITAMNGVVLFGWSTAVIYDVLRTIARAIPTEDGRRGELS
jgi:polyferredoxin